MSLFHQFARLFSHRIYEKEKRSAQNTPRPHFRDAYDNAITQYERALEQFTLGERSTPPLPIETLIVDVKQGNADALFFELGGFRSKDMLFAVGNPNEIGRTIKELERRLGDDMHVLLGHGVIRKETVMIDKGLYVDTYTALPKRYERARHHKALEYAA